MTSRALKHFRRLSEFNQCHEVSVRRSCSVTLSRIVL